MESGFLTNREQRRYGRQVMIPDIGTEGQLKIKNSSVLVIGAGGIGCPVLQYLSAAGVGRLSIIDFDMVDETNLARQALYGSSDLGKLKSIIAKSRLEELNPLCRYTVINKKLDDTGPHDFSSYDVIVDATDSSPTRYVINDACILAGKPMVHGSIYRYEGLISVFNYKNGPSYRDFNPEPTGSDYMNPPAGNVGFFGVLPGLAGMYMTNEVLKILTGTGEVLSGKVLHINISTNTFTTFSIEKSAAREEIPEMAGIMDP